MTKVVIDTNIVVSADLVDKGPSAAILALATNGKVLISLPILAEYEEVLRRPRFKFRPERIEGTLALIRRSSEMVHPGSA